MMGTQAESSETRYRRLVERLFLSRWYRRHSEQAQMFVGELPPQWDLPLPAGAEVLGGHVPAEFHAQVVLDVPGDPKQAVAEIERLLVAEGWRAVPGPASRRRGGGFLGGGMLEPPAAVLLCDYRLWRHLNVTGIEGRSGIAELLLSYNSDPTSFQPCEFTGGMPGEQPSVFPELKPPPGMMQGRAGGGGRGTSASNDAVLIGDLSAEAVEQHYRAQLVSAGWRVESYNASGSWAWSTWEFTDNQEKVWTALLTVAAPPGRTRQRELFLHAALSGPVGGA